MKKIISVIVFLFVVQFGFAQVFYNQTSKNLRYAGGMRPEVIELLTPDEKILLNDCISECGVNPDSVVWVTKEVYDKLDNPDYYNTKVVYKSTSNRLGGVNEYIGQNTLEKPQFMVFIDRYNGEFEVILQMYH